MIRWSFFLAGYVNQEVPVDGRSVHRCSPREDATQLDEVVVIGYGTQSRKMLTSSIASVDAEEIQDLQITTLEGCDAGRAAGVSIQTANGATGKFSQYPDTRRFFLQGNNEPLFIIDGVQRSSKISTRKTWPPLKFERRSTSTIYGTCLKWRCAGDHKVRKNRQSQF